MFDETGTYLGDFIATLEFCPHDMKHNFDLIRELDKESIDLEKELSELQSTYINNLDNLTLTCDEDLEQNNKKLLEQIEILQDRISRRLNHKINVASSMGISLENIIKKLDDDLVKFELELKNSGEFDNVNKEIKGIPQGVEVAVKVTTENELIMGVVISFDPDLHEYVIGDVDETKQYFVNESFVYQLDVPEKKFSRGDHVMAVYPDTTILYPAVVTNAMKKAVGINYMYTTEPTIMVQFSGDADETGVTPNRSVPYKYVIKLPPS